MIIQTVNVHDFRKAFSEMNREDNFSYEGLAALFDYLESLSEDIGENIELDVIAICCDFSEYSLENAKSDWQHLDLDIEDWTDMDALAEALQDYTTVIPVNDNLYIIRDF